MVGGADGDGVIWDSRLSSTKGVPHNCLDPKEWDMNEQPQHGIMDLSHGIGPSRLAVDRRSHIFSA